MPTEQLVVTAVGPGVDPAYRRLAVVLDTLPNGFPPTSSGVELQILARLFTPEEAALFVELKIDPETPAELSPLLGRPVELLAAELQAMWRRGLIQARETGRGRAYNIVPFIVGIFEWQVDRMDAELARLWEEYAPTWGQELMRAMPQLFLVVPAEQSLPPHVVEPYHRASAIVEAGAAFRLRRCICRTAKRALGKGCQSPMETCLAISPTPDGFGDDPVAGRTVSRDEALAVLARAEEAGLVHNVQNTARGHVFICNCCRCCCGMLRPAREYDLARRAFNIHFLAELDSERCVRCGLCAEERCPMDAIVDGADGYKVRAERCLGCGVCVTTCPEQAIRLRGRPPGDCVDPPADLMDWMEQRARSRGVVLDQLRRGSGEST